MLLFTVVIYFYICGAYFGSAAAPVKPKPDPKPPIVSQSKLQHDSDVTIHHNGILLAKVAYGWYSNQRLCANLRNLLKKKNLAVDRLMKEINQMQHLNFVDSNSTTPPTITPTPNLEEQKYKIKLFQLTIKELNSSSDLIFQSIGALHHALMGDLHSILNLHKNSHTRLEALRADTLREEREFAAVLKAEKHAKEMYAEQDAANVTGREESAGKDIGVAKHMINSIIKDVGKKADKLQNELTDNAFEKALSEHKLGKHVNVEAVIKIKDSSHSRHRKRKKSVPSKSQLHEKSAASKTDTKNKSVQSVSESNGPPPPKYKGGGVHHPTNSSQIDTASDSQESGDEGGIIKLIDSHDNTYVLSKGKDSTMPQEDPQLITDLIYLIILASLFGFVCHLLGIPSMFGHITAGVILGPSCSGIIKSVVQVETFGQFGVFLILFCVGLEFSPKKVKPVWKVSLLGSTLPLLIMVLAAMAIGRCMGASLAESAFLGACLSMSSTPLIVQFLERARCSSNTRGIVEDTAPSTPPVSHSNRLQAALFDEAVVDGAGPLRLLLPGCEETGEEHVFVQQHVQQYPETDGSTVAARFKLQNEVELCEEKEEDVDRSTENYGLALLGILVMQDVYLGLVMALLPTLAELADTSTTSSTDKTTNMLYRLGRLLAVLSGMVFVSGLLQRFLMPRVYKLAQRQSREVCLLLILGAAFLYLLATWHLRVSMELGCFLAGVTFSGLPSASLEHLEQLFHPVKDFLAAIFFVGIGLHVFPKFLVWEISLLSGVTALVVILKMLSALAVLRCSLPKPLTHFSCLIAAGLAQVSEFAFVLGSGARKLELVSREVYLLILGVTTLSLLIAPILWRVALCWTEGLPPALKSCKTTAGRRICCSIVRCSRTCFEPRKGTSLLEHEKE